MLASKCLPWDSIAASESQNRAIVFCAKHGLSPSIKSGGYGTAGWAIGGDIIIDMVHFGDVDIEAPRPDGSFTSLRDTAPVNSKGKKRVVATANLPGLGKRRREGDFALRIYDAASDTVTGFLRGTPFPLGPSNSSDLPSQPVRRRLDNDITSGSDVVHQYAPRPVTGDVLDAPGTGNNVLTTVTISRPLGGAVDATVASARTTTASSSADPFGYLNTASGGNRLSSSSSAIQSNFSHTSSHSDSTPIVANPRLPSAYLRLPSQLEPVHQLAYVTFGAGKRQKEVDMYTASNPLEARTVTGETERVPYHVPL